MEEGADEGVGEVKAAFPYREINVMKGHIGPVLCVRFNADGNYCISGGKDRTIQLWNPHKGTHIKTYSGVHGYEVLDVKVTKDNNQFASCGADKVVYVWDVPTARVIRRWRGHTERLNTCAFNNECTLLFTGSYDKTVKVWDLKSRGTFALQTLSQFQDSVSSITVGDNEIVVGSIDGCLRYFDIRKGELITDHICQPISSVCMSNDGHCVLTSCMDATLRLMDKATGELLNEYTGHSNSTYKIESVLSNDDAYVVSGSEDNRIYFWNLVEGKVMHNLEGHTKAVTSLSYHPKEVCLVSGSTDGTIRVWK